MEWDTNGKSIKYTVQNVITLKTENVIINKNVLKNKALLWFSWLIEPVYEANKPWEIPVIQKKLIEDEKKIKDSKTPISNNDR